jgi:hypothetical protein
MDPFTIAFIVTSVVSAGASIAGGIGQKKAAELNAFNMETQRVQNDAIAAQRSNDRYEQFKFAESANRALMTGAMGRDLGGADRSVAAFLKRNRETAFQDLDRIETQRQMDALNYQMQAASERRRGRDAMVSGVVDAFTSSTSAMMRYDQIRMPSSSSGSGLAPSSSMRPMMRP